MGTSENEAMLNLLFAFLSMALYYTSKAAFNMVISFLFALIFFVNLYFRQKITNYALLTYWEEFFLLATLTIFFFLIPICKICLKKEHDFQFFTGLALFMINFHILFSLINYSIYSYDNSAFQSITTNQMEQKTDVTNRYIKDAQELILLNSYVKSCKNLLNLNDTQISREDVGPHIYIYFVFHKLNNIIISVEDYYVPQSASSNFLLIKFGDDEQVEIRNSEFGRSLYKILRGKIADGETRGISEEEHQSLKNIIDDFLVNSNFDYSNIREKLKNYNLNIYQANITDFILYSFNATSVAGNGIISSNNIYSKGCSIIQIILYFYVAAIGAYHFKSTKSTIVPVQNPIPVQNQNSDKSPLPSNLEKNRAKTRRKKASGEPKT